MTSRSTFEVRSHPTGPTYAGLLPGTVTSDVHATLGDRDARRADCDQVTYPFIPIGQPLAGQDPFVYAGPGLPCSGSN